MGASTKERINKLHQCGKLYFSVQQVTETFLNLHTTGIPGALT